MHFFTLKLLTFIVLFLIFVNISLIGTYTPVFEGKSGTLILVHTIVMIYLLIITIIRVNLGTRKTSVKEIRIKGEISFFIACCISLLAPF